MNEVLHNAVVALPTPKEVLIGKKRFLKYGISPVKLAEAIVKQQSSPMGTDANPIMKDGYEYVYNSEGRLVRLDHFDPETMERFVLAPDAALTEEQEKQLADSAEIPVTFDEDCPESTPEQIERFRKFGKERNRRRAEMDKEKLGAN